jgi:hypothetical protein
MSEQQRASFRVETQFEAELFHEGRVVSCTVQNLSAGGALVETALEIRTGSQCTLGLALDPELAQATGLDYVSFHMEVLASQPISAGRWQHRLHNVTRSGSKEYETATKLVFAAQRRAISHETGTDHASPMATDEARRGRLRSTLATRFGRSSLRPGSNDD